MASSTVISGRHGMCETLVEGAAPGPADHYAYHAVGDGFQGWLQRELMICGRRRLKSV
jgi:hypothetical protein